MLTVQIVLFDGFDLLDAIAPYEVFCAAASFAEHELNVKLVTAEGSRTVASGVYGLKIEASSRLNPECAGIILVPGASGEVDGEGPDSIPAILGRAMNTELTGMIGQALDRQDIVVATVCGGSLLLAMGGLLEGRSAVTHHLGMGLLGATGAVPIKARVVDDGSLVTGGGVTSGLDVALYLVERELGPRIAHAVEQLFEYERRGTVWKGIGLAPSTQMSLPDDSEPNAAANHGAFTNAASGHQLTQASIFEGDWDTMIATPVGKMEVRLSISARNDIIEGTATQGDETIRFRSPVLQNGKLAWSLPITKPMRLNLKFEVTADGDIMTGTAKAGMLPASKLTGTRVS
ncbi:DJ-1/PfpI family protein [Paenibacillus sp. BR1-192]|uniref:DJ-1/PfpI family protein n=1 Tax=Paenibacillus sp. BR1-192 TaxID=3032287 RepID=UPI00240DD1A3|nr:DJ-1/PfpI family protein [Paenibacillus sp. BR1-192]WFB61471.1 DJ-1/PfpI family protein [Paenibacillus sp. BR1-192]